MCTKVYDFLRQSSYSWRYIDGGGGGGVALGIIITSEVYVPE